MTDSAICPGLVSLVEDLQDDVDRTGHRLLPSECVCVSMCECTCVSVSSHAFLHVQIYLDMCVFLCANIFQVSLTTRRSSEASETWLSSKLYHFPLPLFLA